MEITARGLWTLIHGMGFGAFYLLAFSGALVEFHRCYGRTTPCEANADGEKFLRVYLVLLALLAWVTVLTGTYLVYPWYRAAAPAGTANLGAYPQRLLLSHPATAAWHNIGMEWKEHVAWLVPIATTMTAAVFARYGRRLRAHAELRNSVAGFLVAAFLAAAVAGFWGAMLNKNAPVNGGSVIHMSGR